LPLAVLIHGAVKLIHRGWAHGEEVCVGFWEWGALRTPL
jgi:hypothetical protein